MGWVPKVARQDLIRDGLQHDPDLALGVFASLRTKREHVDFERVKAECDELLRLKSKLRLAWWQIAVLSGRSVHSVHYWAHGWRSPPPGFVAALRDESTNHADKFERRRRAIVSKYGKGQSGIRGRRDKRGAGARDVSANQLAPVEGEVERPAGVEPA